MNGLDLRQNPINLILDYFGDFTGLPHPTRYFFKKSDFVTFLHYDDLTSCKIYEKIHEPILSSCVMNRAIEQSQIHRTLPLASVSKKP